MSVDEKDLLLNFKETFDGIKCKLYYAVEVILVVSEIVPFYDGTYRVIQIENDDMTIRFEHGNELDEYIKEGAFTLVYDGTEKK